MVLPTCPAPNLSNCQVPNISPTAVFVLVREAGWQGVRWACAHALLRGFHLVDKSSYVTVLRIIIVIDSISTATQK